MADPIGMLVAHVVETLPDSISRRTDLLTGLLAVLPAKHKAHREVRMLLCHLNRHELAQRELPLLFTEGGGR